MKNIVSVLFCLLFCIVCFAQKKNELSPQEVPAEVKASFSKEFPTAVLQNWEKEGGRYEATFKVDQVHMTAEYDKKGYRKEVEKDIEESKLPASVFEYIKKKYPDHKLKNSSQIISDKAVIMYEVEIIKGNEITGLIFDSSGKFKKK